MISLDSSVLVRYLTQDDSSLAAATAALMEGEEEVGVSGVVLLELVHVLRNEPYLQTNPEAGARLLLDSIKASA